MQSFHYLLVFIYIELPTNLKITSRIKFQSFEQLIIQKPTWIYLDKQCMSKIFSHKKRFWAAYKKYLITSILVNLYVLNMF